MMRPCDAAVLLPGASVSVESKALKNIVCELDGSAPNVTLPLFSPSWGHGVSIVRLDTAATEKVLLQRKRVVKAMVDSIPNELRLRSVEVGPGLADCDGCDTEPWTHGFDSAACCAGIYSADEIRIPNGCQDGTSRVHRVYYALAKAGAGRAGQEFHTKLSHALRDGLSLDEAFSPEVENGLSMESLQRVHDAGMRNRSRIISKAMKAVGLHENIALVPDCANCSADTTRRPVLSVNAVTNSLVHNVGSSAGYNHDEKGRWRYYAGSYNGLLSQGICVCSNASHGFISYATAAGDFAVNVRNVAFDSLPFGTPKISSMNTLITKIGSAYKTNSSARSVHADSEWIGERFGWLAPENPEWPDVEPASLWGTHASMNWQHLAHKFSIADLRQVHLRPEAVAMAGTETSKLRAIYKVSR